MCEGFSTIGFALQPICTLLDLFLQSLVSLPGGVTVGPVPCHLRPGGGRRGAGNGCREKSFVTKKGIALYASCLFSLLFGQFAEQIVLLVEVHGWSSSFWFVPLLYQILKKKKHWILKQHLAKRCVSPDHQALQVLVQV